MKPDIPRLLAQQMTFLLLGWYVALGGVASMKTIMLVNWVVLDYAQQPLKWVVCFFVGKTVGLVVRGRARG